MTRKLYNEDQYIREFTADITAVFKVKEALG